MTVGTPRSTNKVLVQAAIESTFDTLPTFVPATDSILAMNPDYQAQFQVIQRPIMRPTQSPYPRRVGQKMARLSFATEVAGNDKVKSGIIGDAPRITRMLRACGYAGTARAAAWASTPVRLDTLAAAPTVTLVTAGTLAPTVPVTYVIEVSTGGASGVAKIDVCATDSTLDAGPASTGRWTGANAVTLTSGSPATIGSKGLTVAFTWTGSLVVGQRWVVAVLPKGVSYVPTSTPTESLAAEAYFDGIRHRISGAFGTFRMVADAGDIARFEWNFMGRYYDPTDTVIPAATYEDMDPPIFETAHISVGAYGAGKMGYNPIAKSVTFDQNNRVVLRESANHADGMLGYRIAGRDPQGGFDPEIELLADNDFWGALSNSPLLPLTYRVGNTVGNSLFCMFPMAQYTGLTYRDRDNIRVHDAGLGYASRGTVGDDEAMFFFW